MYSDVVISEELPMLLTIINPYIKGPLIAFHAEPVSSGISTRILLVYKDIVYRGAATRMEAYIRKDGEVYSYSFLQEIIPLLKIWALQIGEKYRQLERTDKIKHELISKTWLIDGLD